MMPSGTIHNTNAIHLEIRIYKYNFTSVFGRYDYFERNLTPFMNQLKTKGTYSDYMINIFVTKTFPNHHTMATGLYAETHGVVDNEFYDPATGNVTKYSYQLYHYDNSILPIWVCLEEEELYFAS